MESENELDAFRLPNGTPPATHTRASNRRTQPRQTGGFIRGPIPLAWLEPALMMPGRSPVVVALALAYQSGLERSARVRITRKLLKRFHIAPRTCHDALNKLEAAGVIRIHKLPGRCREVEILNLVSREWVHESDLADRDFIVPGDNGGQNSDT